MWLSSDDGGSIYSKDSLNVEDEELFLNLLRNALLEEKFEKATIKNILFTKIGLPILNITVVEKISTTEEITGGD